MTRSVITKQDLFEVLKYHPKAAEAIFWWAFCWHAGAGSDLYAIMCDEKLGYTPNPNDNTISEGLTPDVTVTVPRWYVDQEIHDCFNKLDEAFGPMVQHDYKPVRLRDVQEGQVLIAGSMFGCITHKWPCRVIRKGSVLGVTCSERFHGIDLQPGSEPYFHPLYEDNEGFVVGFRR